MYPNPAKAPQPSNCARHITTHNPKLQALFSKLVDDESNTSDDVDMAASNNTSAQWDDPSRPWLCTFHEYLNRQDNLGDLSLIQWWGVNSTQYPVWASLTQDFLSIMSSSVSAEHVFSSAGITISKRRNCLKYDVMEALQFQKCAAKSQLLFCEDPSLLTEATILDEISEDGGDKAGDETDCDITSDTL